MKSEIVDIKSNIQQRKVGLSEEKKKILEERLRGKSNFTPDTEILSLFKKTWEDVRQRYDAVALKRVEQAIEILYGIEKPKNSDPRQITSTLFFPDLTAKPWHDTKDFPWVTEVENKFAKIKHELHHLLQSQEKFDAYQHPYTKEIGWKGWDTYSLYRQGKWDEAHCQMCPETVEAIRSTPHGLRECMFTKLHPGGHITPHSGGSNLVLTCHLALDIPKGCAIRVESEVRTWEEGKCLIFDDSYMHEVWHHGSETRMVILWDIWHPELTFIEIEALKYIFPIADSYLEKIKRK